MTLDIYVHANREVLWEHGIKLGLSGEALRLFSYAACEVKLTLEVDADGEATITHVDGRKVA